MQEEKFEQQLEKDDKLKQSAIKVEQWFIKKRKDELRSKYADFLKQNPQYNEDPTLMSDDLCREIDHQKKQMKRQMK